MKRRDFLSATLGLSVLGVSLAGCGGGRKNNGGGNVDTVATRASVQLPSGFSLPVSELRAATAWNEEALATDGSFGARVLATDSPGLAVLRHKPSNRPVLLGYIGDGQTGVSPLGTAVALLALSLGTGGYQASARREANALLQQHPATSALADVITQRVATNPFALVEGDAQIVASLQAAVQAVGGAGRSAHSRATRQASEIEPTLRITPDTEQSLFQIKKGVSGNNLQGINRARRPASVYTYRIATVDNNGVRTDLNPAQRVGDPIDMVAVASLTTGIVTLGDRPPWAPEISPDISITATNNATQTIYESVVLMASGKSEFDGEPNFFGDARYAGEVAGWREKRSDLNVNAWIGGILYDIVGTAIGGVLSAAPIAYVAKVASDLRAAAAATSGAAISQFLNLARQGAFRDATVELMEAVTSGNSYLSQSATKALQQLAAQATAKGEAALAVEGIGGTTLAALLTDIALVILGVVAAVGTFLTLGDALVTYSDLLTSSKAERWIATLEKSSVKLDPPTAELERGSDLALTATVQQATGTIRYVWKLDGGGNLANLADTSGHVGQSFESDNATVNLATTPSTQGTLSVTVEAFLIGDGGTRQRIGVGTSQITLVERKSPYYLQSFDVDDNMTLWLNGTVVYADRDGALAGSRGPFTLTDAKKGDTIRLQVRDWYGLYAGISDVTLVRPDGSKKVWLPARQIQTPQGAKIVVVDETLTLD